MKPINKAGACLFCGKHWAELAGGIDKNGWCPKCRGRIGVTIREMEEREEEMV